MKYHIVYSEQSSEDLDNLFDVITFDFKAPQTAFRYIQGIIDTIENLSTIPTAFPVRRNRSLLKYGMDARRVNYKKMAIIYTIHDNIVFIHRIMPGSMITEQ